MTALIDPRTGRPRGDIAVTAPADVDAAVCRARAAAGAWARYTTAERSRRLVRFADTLRAHAAEYARAERSGTGKPLDQALGEVQQSADVIEFFAASARSETTPAGGQRIPGRESWVRWEPIGVVAAIVPWNYPLMMAAWRIGPALAAGNAVVLKPAETTPDSAVLLAGDAGQILGPDILTVVPGDRETGRSLARSAVDMIAFTGSVAAGHEVAASAGIRRTSLELGGNGAAVILPGAPAYTYDELVRACVYNAGQSCAAPARVITLAGDYEQVVKGLTQAMDRHRAGSAFGPLNNPDQVRRFDDLLASSRAGRRFTAELAVPAGEEEGYWRAGVILADLDDDDPAVLEEIFGPVLTVQTARDVAHAVELANSVSQALAASVWAGDTGQALSVATALDDGEAWVNCHLDQTPELPHGGRRGSGTGTDLSSLALTEYQRPKTITVRLD